MRLILVGLLGGCVPKVGLPPATPVAPWSVDRAALPGGTLRVMHTSTIGMKYRQAVAGGGKEATRAPVSVALFEHPTRGPILIDAGYGRATVGDPPEYPRAFIARLLEIEMARPAAEALADVSVTVDAIEQVFVTHLHNDHGGGLADFPDATIRGAAEEWTAALSGGGLSGYDPSPFVNHTFEPLVFDDGPVGPIPLSDDVFGDGSFIALAAVGHTAGHTMYLVNLPEGSWLFTGDAAWIDANWIEGPRPKGFMARTLVDADWKKGISSLHAIRWFSEQRGVVVVSGHEPANLERLAPWPEPLLP